jgi:hypothetical protein
LKPGQSMLGLRGKLSLGAHRERFANRGVTPILITLSATLLLAACQVPQHQLRLASATNSTAPAAVETPAAPAAKPTVPKQTPLATTPAVAHGETIVPTAARLSGDPEQLLGLDHTALRRVLGSPARIRHEITTQVWQYVTGDCVVDLYLYDRSGALKVTYVEARSRSAEPTLTGRCLKSLLERPTASVQ